MSNQVSLFPKNFYSNKRFTDRRSVKIILLIALLALSLLIGLGTYAAAQLKQPYLENAAKKTVVIPKGSNARAVAGILESEKIIRNNKLFLYYLILKGASRQLLAGNYELSGSFTIPEIVQTLTQGKVITNEVRFRIGEGWSLKQVAEEVERTGLGKKDDFYALAGSPPDQGGASADLNILGRHEFLNSLGTKLTLEGYLFPDTYLVSREGGAEELISKALRNFDQRFTQDMRGTALAKNYSLREVIIMASLVEAEVGRNVSGRALTESEKEDIAEERRIVADIFWTRLGIGQALESDATVGYATGKPRRQATLEDLKINSPYNTYRFPGLPPGPIGNPSIAAIEAALNPANTPYLYFLSDPDGKAYFGRTLDEHIANRRKYLPVN